MLIFLRLRSLSMQLKESFVSSLSHHTLSQVILHYASCYIDASFRHVSADLQTSMNPDENRLYFYNAVLRSFQLTFENPANRNQHEDSVFYKTDFRSE